MNDYIVEENIDIEKVGSEFPLKSESRFLYLDANKPSYQEAKIGEKPFIIYSKVINDYKDVDYEKLQADYTLRKAFKFLSISVELYEKR
ncbi:hypothetical protein GCM10007940_09160 [Portibacter lacus]|uniref:Uncharacterized protein n=2 Tax=Portibacter lacus TaxID=1099794 RepID=A0AA37WC95_9BACT|nr:hypothetical protein GCM10007940_09160 [Portibacter lacus]